MILLDSVEEFFLELDQMFTLCRERGTGTVYTTLKKVGVDNCSGSRASTTGKAVETNGRKRPVERKEGWLARVKTSLKKSRRVSVLVLDSEIASFRERLRDVKRSAEPFHVAGGIKKTGRYVGQKSGSKGKAKAMAGAGARAEAEPGTGVGLDQPGGGQKVKGGSAGSSGT